MDVITCELPLSAPFRPNWLSACLLVEETDGHTPSSRGHVTHVRGGTAANLTDAAATAGHISIRRSSRVSEHESADFTSVCVT